MTATTEFFWPAGIQRPPFRHGLITSNIVSNIVNYSAILLTLLQAILNQVLPPSFSVSTSVVFLTGKTARQPYLAALLRPRAYGPHWRHGRSHSHGNPRERFTVVGGGVIRDLSSPQCQPSQTYCTAGECLLTCFKTVASSDSLFITVLVTSSGASLLYNNNTD